MKKTIKGKYSLFIGYIFILFTFFVFLYSKAPKAGFLLTTYIFLILIGYFIIGLGYDYYEINKDKLVVKNLFFWWKRREYNLKDIEIFRLFNRGDGHTAVTINEDKYTSNSLTRRDQFELIDTMRELLDIEVEFPQDPRKKDEFD